MLVEECACSLLRLRELLRGHDFKGKDEAVGRSPFVLILLKAPSQKPAVCCCVVVAAAYTNRGGRPGLPNCGFNQLA